MPTPENLPKTRKGIRELFEKEKAASAAIEKEKEKEAKEPKPEMKKVKDVLDTGYTEEQPPAEDVLGGSEEEHPGKEGDLETYIKIAEDLQEKCNMLEEEVNNKVKENEALQAKFTQLEMTSRQQITKLQNQIKTTPAAPAVKGQKFIIHLDLPAIIEKVE
jgi:hypothetical protein